MSMSIVSLLIFAIGALSVFFWLFTHTAVTSFEIDLAATVTHVLDGDTFDIDRNFSGFNRIRLADIDTPKLGEPNSTEATDFISNLVHNSTVYLDVDDKYIVDTTGTRLVCVVFVSFNSTHYLNVNKALLDAGLAKIYEHDNEFDPNRWALYFKK